MAFTLFAVSIMVFSLSRVTGDPRLMYIHPQVTKQMWDEWGRVMGLDKPVPVQYLIWVGKAIRGDLGDSHWERRAVTSVIWEKLPATLLLGLAAFIFALACVPLGVLSAVRRGTVWDYTGRFFAIAGLALPPFWVGLMLILIFAVQLDWLPPAKTGGIEHFILPTIAFGWGIGAGMLRLVRSSLLGVLDEEYIKLARAKGVSRQTIIWKHAFKNASITPLTYGGILLASVFTGGVVTESVFAWPGIGRMAVETVLNNDFPLLAGLILLFTLMFVIANLVVDLLYSVLDPRIKYS